MASTHTGQADARSHRERAADRMATLSACNEAYLRLQRQQRRLPGEQTGSRDVLEPLRTNTIDHAADSAQIWLRAIAAQLDGDVRTAYHALRGVLHILRDRLPLPDAVGLGAQLPLLIRGIYYEDWSPHATPPRARHVEEFLGVIERSMADVTTKLDPQQVVAAVSDQLRAHLPATDLARVLVSVPAGLRLLLTTAIAARTSSPFAPPVGVGAVCT